jgi:uncharacterized membrane protein
VSATHLHLVINHLPILGIPFGIALLAAGVLRRSLELKRAALVTFALAALFVVPVFLTGEPAEETVERLPGVSEVYIERHEDLAKLSLALTSVLGILSLIALVGWRQKDLPGGLQAALLTVSLLSAASLGLTGAAGGAIRHSEIRPSSVGGHLPNTDEDAAYRTIEQLQGKDTRQREHHLEHEEDDDD